MENAGKPIRIPEEQSETAYSTTRAMEFIGNRGIFPGIGSGLRGFFRHRLKP